MTAEQLALFKVFCRDMKRKAKVTVDDDVDEKSEEKVSSPPPEKKKRNDNLLWMLTKGKYLLTFYLCRPCQDILFHSKDKTVRNESDSSVTVKIVLCESCAKLNCQATSALLPKKKD